MRYHVRRVLTTAMGNIPFKKGGISPFVARNQKLSTNIQKYIRPLAHTQFPRKNHPSDNRMATSNFRWGRIQKTPQNNLTPQEYLKYTSNIPKYINRPKYHQIHQEYIHNTPPQVYLKYTQICLKLLRTQTLRFYIRYRPPNHLNPVLIPIKASFIKKSFTRIWCGRVGACYGNHAFRGMLRCDL